MNPSRRSRLIVTWILTAFLFAGCHSGMEMILYSDEDNDLYQLLKSAGKYCQHFSDVEEALRQCEPDGVLLILAREYPLKKTIIPESFYQIAEKKNLCHSCLKISAGFTRTVFNTT